MPVGKRVNFDESFRDAPQFDVRSLARSRTLLILDDLTGRSRRSHRFMKISPLSLHAVQEFTRRRAVRHIAHTDGFDQWQFHLPCHVISHCSSWLTRSVSRSVAKNYSSRRVNVCTAVLLTISWPVLSILTHTDYNAG